MLIISMTKNFVSCCFFSSSSFFLAFSLVRPVVITVVVETKNLLEFSVLLIRVFQCTQCFKNNESFPLYANCRQNETSKMQSKIPPKKTCWRKTDCLQSTTEIQRNNINLCNNSLFASNRDIFIFNQFVSWEKYCPFLRFFLALFFYFFSVSFSFNSMLPRVICLYCEMTKQ